MKQVDLHDAKTHLLALVDRAAAGEEIVIAKNGKPCARLAPLTPDSAPKPKRQFGTWARRYPEWSLPNAISEFTDEEMAEWENHPVFPPGAPT